MKTKDIIIGLGVATVAVLGLHLLKKAIIIKRTENESHNFSGKESDSKKTESTPPPMTFLNVQKWVYSIEDGKEYCRWYDRYGKNTRTYNTKCSGSQANMYKEKI